MLHVATALHSFPICRGSVMQCFFLLVSLVLVNVYFPCVWNEIDWLIYWFRALYVKG